MPTHVGDLRSAAPPRKSDKELEEEVYAFYKRHAPSKIDSVPKLIEKYRGHMEKLLQKLHQKYLEKPLQTAMEQREVAVLKKAIEVAEREVAVDRTVVEVSGCLIWTHATHA